jgi:hypothetical protein
MGTGKVQTSAVKKPAQPTANEVVGRCLKLLSGKPARVKHHGEPKPGGRQLEYPKNVPNWSEKHREGDVYYRVVVRGGMFEIREDNSLPDRRYRDPLPAEVDKLVKRYGDRLCQGQVCDFNDYGRKKCGHALYYRFRSELPKAKDNTKEYEKLVDDYRVCWRSSSSFLKSFLPSVAEYKRMVERYRKVENYKRFRESLPKQIRACHPTVGEFRDKLGLIEEIKKEFYLIEDAINDWLTIETSAKPVLDEIERYYMRDVKSLDFAERRYLMKKIHTALEIGVPSEEIIDVAADLVRPRKASWNGNIEHEWLAPEAFIHALTTVINLKLAKWLHYKNIEMYGVGISEDFVEMVDRTVQNIRDRRTSFRQLSKAEEGRGTAAMHTPSSNTFSFPRIEKRAESGSADWFSTTVHESTHSFNDWGKKLQTRPENENCAHNNDKKTEMASAWYWAEYAQFERLGGRFKDMKTRLLEINRNNRARMTLCLGFNSSMAEWLRNEGSAMRLRRRAGDGFEKELKGGIVPQAHEDIKEYAARIDVASWIYGYSNAFLYKLGSLYNSGRDAEVEDILKGACSAFHVQRSKLADEKTLIKMNVLALQPLLENIAIIQSAILFLDPTALPKLNEVVERKYFPFFVDMFHTLPEINDGV